ncbi:MAG: hypothetical protein IPM02_21090 [Betaproteobacteria bacterium]|nr:hypothetical protein [Betaproteobacteria bacterium]
MPPLQAHDVMALPLAHVAVNRTMVPGLTGLTTVFGDWLMLQLPGAA